MKKIILIALVGLVYACGADQDNTEYETIEVSPMSFKENVTETADSVFLDWEIFVLSDYTVCNSSGNSVNVDINLIIDRPIHGKINTSAYTVTYDQGDKLLLIEIERFDTGGPNYSSLDQLNLSFDYSGVQAANVHYFGFKYKDDSKRKKVVSADPDLRPFVCN